MRRVALADKLHNARTIVQDYREQGEAIWSVFSTGKEGILWFYHSLLDMYRESPTSPMVEELARVVGELERLLKEKDKSKT